MNKTLLEQHMEAVSKQKQQEKLGENIGNLIVAACKLAVFLIILHFAWKFW
jgi:hypothetical protein